MVTVYTESCRSRVGYHPTIVPTCAQIYWLVWQSGLWQYPRRWLAYAGIAGVPAVYGLYALPLALIAYAVFGSSRTLGLGPDSALAMLSAATVGGLATQGSEEFLALSIALALIVGVLFIIFGLLRLGWVANFLANPVLKGFMQGLALVVLIGQLPKIFGVEGASGNFFQELWAIITQLPQANLVTTIIGFSSLAALFALKKFLPKAPAALITVIFAIFGAAGCHIGGSGSTGTWCSGARFGRLLEVVRHG